MDVGNFVNNASIPTQFILLSQLNTCRFLIDIIKAVNAFKSKGKNSTTCDNLYPELALTTQILMKGLG
jgi:hypothetical protein